MMPRNLLTICLALGALSALLRADEQPRDIAADLAAEAGDGAWKIRKREFYVHLSRYNAAHPIARRGLEDYLKERVVTREAAKRKVTVTHADAQDYLADADRILRKRTGGKMDLEKMAKQQEISMAELRRRSRSALMREAVARSIFRERDKSWPRDKRVADDAVALVIDTIYQKLPKEFDLNKLKKGVLAKLGDIEVTEYEYGRHLIHVLPRTEMGRALNDLILAQEVNRLLGGPGKPNPEDLESEKRAYIKRERDRLMRLHPEFKDPAKITPEMIRQVIAQRGMTLEKIYANPGFSAQARARGHFMRKIDKAGLKKFYEENRGKYGDRLRVRRILVMARAQAVLIAGKKVRNLEQGRARVNAIALALDGGADFATLATADSDDPDFIRKNGGLVPLWLTSDRLGYRDTWQHANKLKKNEISRPFFSAGRGYVLVKLLKRKRALSFDAQQREIRRDSAEYDYRLWQGKSVNSAIRSRSLFE